MRTYPFLSILFLMVLMACNAKQKGTASDEETSLLENITSDIELPQSASPEKLDSIKQDEKDIVDNTSIMDPFDPDVITGTWEAETQNGFSFSIWFMVEDNFIMGQYCAMNEDASRVDCGTAEELEFCYIKAPYPTRSSQVVFDIKSCYSQKTGSASLSIKDNGDILWHLIESPGEMGKDHFAPKQATLTKTSIEIF